MSNFFESMCGFARQTKVVRMAAPEDILSEKAEWSAEDMLKPFSQRGQPVRTRLEIRSGAPTMDFKIRPLSMAEREKADAMTDVVIPPPSFVEELPDRPGQPIKKVFTGHDYDDPKYVNDRRPAESRQAAYVVLKGVDGLEADTPGADDAAKVEAIMDKLPFRLIKFLAVEIWSMSYAQGDPADFFSKEDSPPSPGSEPSLSPSQEG